MGAINVLVSMGKDGAILVDENDRVYDLMAPEGKVVNTVGAGDSMVAGFIAGVDKGYEYALLLGIAAGAATASNDSLSSKSEILNLMNEWVDIIENS